MSAGTDWIVVSAHAYERWHERTDAPGHGPRVAWFNGFGIDCRAIDADEARYHQPTDTVLIRKEGTLVTVLDVADSRAPVQDAVDDLTTVTDDHP